MFKITIDNEEVLCDKNFTIQEEMLNTSSVILNNVFPKTWELDKDYVSRFYYPKDYSKCKIFNETIYPTEPGTTQVGTNLTTSDVDLTKMNTIALEGQSYQTTTQTGKNLLNPDKILENKLLANNIGQTATFNNNNSWIMVDDYVPVDYNDKYTLSRSEVEDGQFLFAQFDKDKKLLARANQSIYNTNSYTYTINNQNTRYLMVGYRKDYGHTNMMLEKGNTATAYVPFVPNSPSPDYPQPIESTTGLQKVEIWGKNLFDINGQTTGTSLPEIINNGFKLTKGTNRFCRFVLPNECEAGTYTISYDLINYNLSGSGNLFSCTLQYGSGNTAIQTIVLNNSTSLTFTTTQAFDRLYFFIASSQADTATITIDNVQLEKGNQATTYEAYNGTTKEINLGKNLFDIDTITYTSNGRVTISISDNSITQTNTTNYARGTYYLKGLEVGTTYTISTDFINDNGCSIRLDIYNSTDTTRNVLGAETSNTSGKLSLTFTANETTQCLRIYSNTTSTSNNYSVVYTNIQLEKGNQATSYAPYKEPMYLYGIGNYRDCFFENVENSPYYDSTMPGGWYLRRIIGTKIINGSGNWATAIITDGNKQYYISNTKLTGYLKTTGITTMCETFKAIENRESNSTMINEDNNTICLGSKYDNFYIRHDDIQNIKSYFQSNPTNLYYVLDTPSYEPIDDKEILDVLQEIKLISGINNISITSPYLTLIANINYNYVQGYTEEDMLFCGVVENTGNISLNPRHPHYCNLQVLDFKTFLSEGETLDFVIYEKTIEEAIDQVISVIAPYGFVKGNINILHGDDVIGAYSTKDKTAYDVFNYLADITQSRWTTRMIDENTIAIDFYDPSLMPSGTAIEYNQTWFCNNKILDMSFNYSSKDYRNKQVMLSGEVYANVSTTEIITADGYQTQFNTTDKIGYVQSILLNGSPATIITKEEYDLGYEGDFIYQPGNPYFESDDLVSTGAIITIVYYAVIEGREVILNQTEINRVEGMTGRKGVIARYENRNDATTTVELNQIGQSYLKYKGSPEITLKVQSLSNIWNIGERVSFTAPLTELTTEYMVKKKSINYIATQNNIFYTFELTSSFNSETDINYFDNQRAKTMGNIGVGEYISRNVDIENEANVIFYDLEVNEVQIDGVSTLQSTLQSPLGVE